MVKVSNLIVTGLSGFIFATSWWVFIDACAFRDKYGGGAGPFVLYLPGILATLGLFILNNIRNALFEKGDAWGAEDTAVWEKILIVVAIMLHLASLICAIWVFADWNKKGKFDLEVSGISPSKPRWYQGVASIVQAVGIIVASCLWRFAWRSEDSF